MTSEKINILFIGDIIGKPGRKTVKKVLPDLANEYSLDLVVANGENSAAGFGITPDIFKELKSIGIDVVTTGNHIWDKKEINEFLEDEPNLIRPANYSDNNPGSGSTLFTTPSGHVIAIVNLAGRVFMGNSDCPFTKGRAIVDALKKKTNIIMIDFHGEATSEKVAAAMYFDGDITLLTGTHSHVQTADERILEGGTAFITDAGMTGPQDSIIGMEKESIIKRFLTQTPQRFEVAKGKCTFSGVVVTADSSTGKALEIKRIQIRDVE